MMTVASLAHRIKMSPVLAILLLTPVASFSALLGFWAQQRAPCYEILEGNPRPNPSSPGQSVDLQWKVNVKTQSCSATFFRVLEQPGSWVWATRELSSTFSILRPGINYTHSSEPMIIPNNVEDGEYRVYTVVKFTRNPLQRWINWPIIYYGPYATINIKTRAAPSSTRQIIVDPIAKKITREDDTRWLLRATEIAPLGLYFAEKVR